MTYQVPELTHLCKCIQEISSTYIDSNTAARIDQIKMLESLLTGIAPTDDMHEIILGAWIFILDAIQTDYDRYYFSYLRSAINSQLFRLAQKALGIDEESNKDKPIKNILDNQTRFTCLSAFFKHLNKNKKDFPLTLLASAETITEQAKNNLSTKITSLCTRLPTIRSLRDNFRQLPHYYEEKCANDSTISKLLAYVWIGGRNPKRKQAIKFIEILDERCCKLTHDEETSEKPQDYFIRFGALLKIMREIENECLLRGSAKKSDLYKEISRITNTQSTDDLCFEFKEADLAALDQTLCRDVISEEKMAFWKKHNFNKTTLEQIKDDIILLRADYTKQKNGVLTNSPTFNKLVNDAIDCVAATIARSGVVYAIYEFASFLTSSSLSFETMLTIATPQNALIVMSCLWALKKFQSNIGSFLTSLCIPYVSPIVSLPVKKAFSHPFFAAHETNRDLSSEDYQLIQALYNASDEIVSRDEKRQLELLFDLDKPEIVGARCAVPA